MKECFISILFSCLSLYWIHQISGGIPYEQERDYRRHSADHYSIDDQEKVDEKALRALIDHCINNGIHGIFVCGSNGECMALTQEQRDRAIQITLDHCAGRVPVIAGCMDSSTQRAIENVKRFEDMGGQTAVITPVFYARHATQDETVQHFEQISRNTSANLMIYNIPPFTGQLLTADTIIQLSKIDKVIGVKDTSGNYPLFIKLH